MPHVVCGLCIPPVYKEDMNKNTKNQINAALEKIINSDRYEAALVKVETFGRFPRLHTALKTVAQAAVEAERGAAIDISKVVRAIELINDETRTFWNNDEELSL